jgi:23S rRNA (cytidine2498-2'-O)-methyltransferase
MLAEARFLFTVCQTGAEKALKEEMAHAWPAFRFAFSRPGFVTFKLPAEMRMARDLDLGCTFARTYGFSLGKTAGAKAQSMAASVWQMVGDLRPAHLHVWQRDTAVPGERGFEPGPTPLADAVGGVIAAARPGLGSAGDQLPVNREAKSGELVLDCVLVEPDEWWVGFHEATSKPGCWPGGVPPREGSGEVISRAYWKIKEALAWSRLPIRRGDRCAEIGSAPGGACQALLESGLEVLGIDPAEMDPELLAQPGLTHVKKRARDVKRREFRQVKWLFSDSNVDPRQALDVVEEIVTHREVRVRGMLLTIKLSDWQMAKHVPDYLARVQSWGFAGVQARQLAFNRREFCLAARRSS